APPLVLSSAPIPIRAPGTRATSVPMAIFARIGGSNCGSDSGDGKGNPGGVAGDALPAETSGLLPSGRSRNRAMFLRRGSWPRRVPVSSPGTRVAEDWNQLFDPATLRPSDQGSLPVGSQKGVFTSEASCTRRMLGAAPAPAWWTTLLCISTDPWPSCTRTALAGPGRVNRIVLLTILRRPWLRPLRSPPA